MPNPKEGSLRRAMRLVIDGKAEIVEADRDRIARIHAAARKYRVAPEDLPRLLDDAKARLAALAEADDTEALAASESAASANYLAAARRLSAERHAAAKRLSDDVTAAMQSLAMAGGRFAVVLLALPEGNAHGLEAVEFHVAAHAGMTAAPLAKVASGGELSRVSLAIQVIVSRVAKVPTLIFDEVDVGIGGRVAEIGTHEELITAGGRYASLVSRDTEQVLS